MSSFTSGVVLCTTLLFMGAGCNMPNTAQTLEKKSAATESSSTEMRQEELANTTITLQAEAKGNKEVRFSWEITGTMPQTEKFRLIRSSQPNPEFNGKNYWLQVDSRNSEYIWIALPKGNMHVRLCSFNTETETCDIYSNDVMVEVK